MEQAARRKQRRVRAEVLNARKRLRDVCVSLTTVVSDVGDQLTLLTDRTRINVTKNTDRRFLLMLAGEVIF